MTDPVRILVKRDELTLEVNIWISFWFMLFVWVFNAHFFCHFSVSSRVSNSFLLLLREKSGNLIHCVISMIH